MRIASILVAQVIFLAGQAFAQSGGTPNEGAMSMKIESLKKEFWDMMNPLQEAFEEGAKILDYYNLGNAHPTRRRTGMDRIAEPKGFTNIRSALREYKEDMKKLFEVNKYITGKTGFATGFRDGGREPYPQGQRNLDKMDDLVATMRHMEEESTGKGWGKQQEKAKELRESFEAALEALREFMTARDLPQDFHNASLEARSSFPFKYLAYRALDNMINSSAWTHNGQWLHWADSLLTSIKVKDKRAAGVELDKECGRNPLDATYIDGMLAEVLFKRFKDYLYDYEQHKKHTRYERDRYHQKRRHEKESDSYLLTDNAVQKAIKNWGPGHAPWIGREGWNKTFPMRVFEKAYDPKDHPRGFDFWIYDALKQVRSKPRQWYPGPPPPKPWPMPAVPPNSPEESIQGGEEEGEESSSEEPMDSADFSDRELEDHDQDRNDELRPWNDPNRVPAKDAFRVKKLWK